MRKEIAGVTYICEQETMHLLGVTSKRTMRTYRNKKGLAATRFADGFYYQEFHLQQWLSSRMTGGVERCLTEK